MTLSCSQHGYEEPVWEQDRATFLRAHEHGFLEFAGVPRTVRSRYVPRNIFRDAAVCDRVEVGEGARLPACSQN